jgi:TPR repeat protein
LGKWIFEAKGGETGSEDKLACPVWLLKAQEAGSLEASRLLSRMFEEGIIVERDLYKAYRHMKKAASLGDPESHLALAKICLSRSIEDESELAKAVKYARKAVKHNVPEAAYLLGLIHENDRFGEQFDLDLAFVFMKKAASLKFTPGIRKLASFYETGKGVKPDARKALSLTKRAAKAGDRESMLKLSVMYKTGEMVKQDARESKKWLKLSESAKSEDPRYEGL